MSRKKKTAKHKNTRSKKNKQKSIGTTIKNIIVNIFMLLLLLVGLALVFNNQIKNYLVKDTTNKHTISNVTRADVKKMNKKRPLLTLTK